MREGSKDSIENEIWSRAEAVLELMESEHFQQYVEEARYPKAVIQTLKGVTGKGPTSWELRSAMKELLPKVKILQQRSQEQKAQKEQQLNLQIDTPTQENSQMTNDWPENYLDENDAPFPPGWEAIIDRQDHLYPMDDD